MSCQVSCEMTEVIEIQPLTMSIVVGPIKAFMRCLSQIKSDSQDWQAGSVEAT